jgi:hypothetical protein
MHPILLEKAQRALKEIEPLLNKGWPPAESIARQLRWVVAFASNAPREERPGNFSMGLLATREFDMWGNAPDLAALINEIQKETERALD